MKNNLTAAEWLVLNCFLNDSLYIPGCEEEAELFDSACKKFAAVAKEIKR